MRIAAVVPAKGTSARIENKNLRILDGEFLFKRKLRQLLDCTDIDLVCLDTESDSLAALAADLPVRRIKRPLSLATNATDGHELFAWECSQFEADIYIQSLCTAPFVSAATVSRALAALRQSPEYDSLVAVSRTKQYLWVNGEPLYGRERIPNSVDLPETVVEAMSLYIVRGEAVRSRKRFGAKPLLFTLDPTEQIDVNLPEDLVLAETIAAGQRARENLGLAALAPHLTSSLLSDITREFGLNQTLPREISGKTRFFGRAKTLQLEEVGEGESWHGIYDALKSYDFVRPGDVITVGNKVPNHAYFGELNAQIAMRAGAVGAVVDGLTRDADAVGWLGFPVFARGNYCLDIKFKGLMRSMNLPIVIGDVAIHNGDYVFADSDGVVVIPRSRFVEVRAAALSAIEKEWRIGVAVALGRPAVEIFESLGEF